MPIAVWFKKNLPGFLFCFFVIWLRFLESKYCTWNVYIKKNEMCDKCMDNTNKFYQFNISTTFVISSLTNIFLTNININFSSKSLGHLHSLTVWNRDLTFWENVHLPPCVTCHVSYVTCPMSHVKGHMSHVTCHISLLLLQSGGVIRWMVCYQRNLLPLVLITPIWRWHIYNGHRQIWTWSEKCD